MGSINASRESLKILHVLRAPVGGLFRHVVDLASGQAARGHHVGLIVDASTGAEQAEQALSALSPLMSLGITSVPMSRQIGWSDLSAIAHVRQRAAAAAADVLHGHGAKGGAYARLAGCDAAVRIYTPHGGSLHYDWSSPAGFVYLMLERLLIRRTDLFLFESAYGRHVFRAKLRASPRLSRVVHNGVAAAEFEPICARDDAADLVFVGELRFLKGVDLLIQAIALLVREGRRLSAVIVGAGPDRAAFEAQVHAQGLGEQVRFAGTMPARAAFPLGRLLVIPSRAESLPYIVLEAAAAGVPLITTKVGGIAEIFGPDTAALVGPGDATALARAIATALGDIMAQRELAARLRERVRAAFSAETMTDSVLSAYRTALAQQPRYRPGMVLPAPRS